MWAGPPKYDGVYDVDDSVTALVRTEGPVFTVHGAWAQNIDENEQFIDFMGDKGGIRLTYGGEFTLYTTEHGALVKYVPEAKTRNMFETEINSFVRCIRTGKSCRPTLTQQCLPPGLCRRFMIPLQHTGK